MKKYIYILVILSILDVLLFVFYKNINKERTKYNIIINSEPILIQIKDIVLKDVNDFNINDFFYVYSYKDYSIKYQFDEKQLLIDLNNIKYSFDYQIEEPNVIEKVIYQEIEKPIIENNYDFVEEEYFHVNNEYLEFELDTDLDYIRQILYENINTTYQTSIDYSRLNVSQIGQYSVFYSTNDKKIEIFVKIG